MEMRFHTCRGHFIRGTAECLDGNCFRHIFATEKKQRVGISEQTGINLSAEKTLCIFIFYHKDVTLPL